MTNNNANSVVTIDLTASTTDEVAFMDASQNGVSRSGIPTNGDIVISLPPANIQGQQIQMIVNPRTNPTLAKVYVNPNGSDTVNGQSTTYNVSFVDTFVTSGSSQTIESNGAGCWITVGHE